MHQIKQPKERRQGKQTQQQQTVRKIIPISAERDGLPARGCCCDSSIIINSGVTGTTAVPTPKQLCLQNGAKQFYSFGRCLEILIRPVPVILKDMIWFRNRQVAAIWFGDDRQLNQIKRRESEKGFPFFSPRLK